MTSQSTHRDFEPQIDHKYPWWDGNWSTFEDYRTRVELRADSCKPDELGYLGPRLASNLTGRAFDSLGEIDRKKLKEDSGWEYLLNYLKDRRGRTQIDVLGDTFSEFFIKKENYRRDGEEVHEFETRYRNVVRRMDIALKEAKVKGHMPQEVYGWFLLNVFMRMDLSDCANVRGRVTSYKMDDVWETLKQMWSSGGLGARDAELRKKKSSPGQTYSVETNGEQPYDDDETEPGDEDEDQGVKEWYEESLAALAEDPSNEDILANFREARKALDQSRTSRGFYPVKNPGGRGRGQGRGGAQQRNFPRNQARPGGVETRTCIRCGKKGHIARNCPQKPNGSSGANGIGFVSYALACENGTHDVESHGVAHRENDGNMRDECPVTVSTSPQQDDVGEILVTWAKEIDVIEYQETEGRDSGTVFALGTVARGRAIIDSGASDSIVGAETLQELAECFDELQFDAEEEISIDRQVHKTFIYGNNESSAGLGPSHVNAGVCGKEMKIQAHMVEGGTPFLLSSKFLYDMDATINFRTGMAVFKAISDQQFRLERSPSHHLMLPLTAFAGNEAVLERIFVQEAQNDATVQKMSSEVPDVPTSSTENNGEEGRGDLVDE